MYTTRQYTYMYGSLIYVYSLSINIHNYSIYVYNYFTIDKYAALLYLVGNFAIHCRKLCYTL